MPMAKIGLMLHETITDFSYDVYFFRNFVFKETLEEGVILVCLNVNKRNRKSK